MTGLSITRDEFFKMPAKQQNTIIFDNTEEIKKLINEEQKKLQLHIDKDLFDHRLQWTAIAVVFLIAGVLKYFGYL